MRREVLIGVAAGALLTGTAATAASRWLITSTHQIKPSVLRQLRGARGKPGPRGQAGPAGTPGSFSTSNVTVVQGALVDLCSAGGPQVCNVGVGSAECPGGAVAISGGWNDVSALSQSNTITEDAPSPGDTAWFVGMVNHDTVNAMAYTPYVVCAKA